MRHLRFWRRRQAEDDDLDRELAVHLALEIDEQVERGVPRSDARLAARRAFGSVALTKEELREMRPGATIDRLGREMRQAARRLVRTPTFTLAAVLTLGLAIAANVAIFAVVHRVVLNPLPYGDSAQLIALDHAFPARNIPSGVPLTLRIYYQYLDRARTLDGIAVHRTGELTLTGNGTPERIRVARTTPSLAAVLRVSPEEGRWFTDDEGMPGAAPAVVLSHGIWVRRFGRNPDVLGRRVTLDGVPTTIVGVMPASYAFPDARVDLWIPEPLSRALVASPTIGSAYDFIGIARLRQGATLADVRSELPRLAAELAPIAPGNGYEALVSAATLLIDATVGRVATTLWILLAAVGIVLAAACANVANLFLVRADAKQREVAVRRALGAGSGGIAGYFLAESAWLAFAGGGLGIVLAWGAVHCLVAFGPANLPRLHEVRIDAVALAFGVALSLAAGLMFGAIPLVRLGPVAVSLHERGRSSTASRSRYRIRQLLMSAQIALALVLLVSSGLMVSSFQKLRAVDPGFDRTAALTFRVGVPPADYPDRMRMAAAHRAIVDRLTTLPGVTAVSASTCLPLAEQSCMAGPLFVEGRALAPGTPNPLVRFVAVAGGFFETMGTPVMRGRSIAASDVERREPVVVVNDALVKIAFQNQDPIGQRVRLGSPSFSTTPNAPGWFTVVGIVANTSTRALAEATPAPKMYLPMFGERVSNIMPALNAMSYIVRTAIPSEALTVAARRAVSEVDANLALAQVLTLQELLDRSSSQMAFTMVLILIAAGVAMMLGVIGIYGAVSYIVSQRTGEIGVRLALGALPSGVTGMIVREGGMVALAGVIAGLATAFAGGRFIDSLLFGVSPRDPAVFAGTASILFGVALLACWLPARRAARLNPLEALRAE